MARLPGSFYQSDVVEVAKGLIGMLLVSKINGITTSGFITETEAYHQNERACHAYNGRKTKRTSVLFEPGGISYVYLCYGIHHLLNVTTGSRGEAAAVLIRAIQPVEGLASMSKRRQLSGDNPRITAGPGNLTKALGITLKHNARSMVSDQKLWIESHTSSEKNTIIAVPRIGVDYAGSDAYLPWRFYLENNKWVSKTQRAS